MKTRNSGFTLAELLVSIVIGAISIAAAFASYNYFNKSYKLVSQKASINSFAREGLAVIARDLRNAGYIDINYDASDKNTKLIGVTKNYLDSKFDKLIIWYTTSPTERVQIEYTPTKYINNKYQGTNENRMYLSRKVIFGSVTRDATEFVSNISDFQVVFKNREGQKIINVGDTSLEARANMKKVHTAEIYLTIESSKETSNIKQKFLVNNDTNSLSFYDKYFRDTFFVSVHTRNLAKHIAISEQTGTSIGVSSTYN
jgi:prepilin-type N-terminal cleavage/methylation domain-containing protein